MATDKEVLMVPIVAQDHMTGTIIANDVLTIAIKAGLLVIAEVIPITEAVATLTIEVAVTLITEAEVIPIIEVEATRTIEVGDIPITEVGITLTTEVADTQTTVAEIILVETPMGIKETIIAGHPIITTEVVAEAEAIVSQAE